MALSEMQRVHSPVDPVLYPLLAVVLITLGLLFTASFFIYEVTSSKFSRNIVRELATGGVASVLLGFGSLFLLLWTGVYV
ncbi:hypothetical protein KFL_001740030 [Klebsormidium nitens]|uniref:Dolichyl-diphosphooligosaccharide-protein glycosyltransferase subunit OST5 n=1 Tax=Klebsormidium nitens TaxID=105231 RepID=A0A1Y1HZF8_KLENI|nr:hypothetical protein KFL_001740030 [Klebsormidium nitens]|eukprot:GAQ84044.1 hypothetical protein KFL_001740030 [Klebsormidium nitens]